MGRKGPSQRGHPQRKGGQAGDSVQVSEGSQAWNSVGLSKDERETAEGGGSGEGEAHQVFPDWGKGLGCLATRCFIRRKALEMSCAIQNQLARILAEFEMTLERDVLQPLSKLSEVTLLPSPLPLASPASSSHLPSPLIHPSLCLHPGGAASHPQAQENPAEAGVRLEQPQKQVPCIVSLWRWSQNFEALPILGRYHRAHWVQCGYLSTHLAPRAHVVRIHVSMPLYMGVYTCVCQLEVTPKPRIAITILPRSLDWWEHAHPNAPLYSWVAVITNSTSRGCTRALMAQLRQRPMARGTLRFTSINPTALCGQAYGGDTWLWTCNGDSDLPTLGFSPGSVKQLRTQAVVRAWAVAQAVTATPPLPTRWRC